MPIKSTKRTSHIRFFIYPSLFRREVYIRSYQGATSTSAIPALIDVKITELETQNVAQDVLMQTLQAQLAELQAQIACTDEACFVSTELAQIEANTVDISYLKTLLGIDPLNPADVSITGKLTAETVEGGRLVIKVIDEDSATIGTAEITPVEVDEDGNGLDDETGSDGKSIKVMTGAVSAETTIFSRRRAE